MISLAFIWLLLIAFIIIMYIILDGFTLGIGLLFPWIRDDNERDIMVSTVLPVWDGNETWLVFAGAGLYGAFPLAFSTLLPILYLPLMLLIAGLLFRGVAFEFRLKAHNSKPIWDGCLFIGSLMAVAAQGLIVAIYAGGFTTDSQSGAIIAREGINWFSLFCVLALIIAYTLLGSARLLKRTTDMLQAKLFTLCAKFQWLLLLAFILVGIFSPLSYQIPFKAWFDPEHNILMFIFPPLILFFMVIHCLAIYKRKESLPFIALIAVFITAYTGFIASNLPFLVPGQITFSQAQSDDGALLFMLFGAIILIPLLLFYTAYAYRIFRGKSHEKIGY